MFPQTFLVGLYLQLSLLYSNLVPGVNIFMPRMENIHSGGNWKLPNWLSSNPENISFVQRYTVWILLTRNGDEHVRPSSKGKPVHARGRKLLWKQHLQMHWIQTHPSCV